MVFYHESDKVYKVITTAGPEFELNGKAPLFLPYTVDLSVKPYKYSLESYALEDQTTRNR